MILVNAVYFKSRWAVAFDKKLTKNEFFSLTRSRQEMVPTMLQRANHPVVARRATARSGCPMRCARWRW